MCQQRNDLRIQWNPITVFNRGFRTSQSLGMVNLLLYFIFVTTLTLVSVLGEGAKTVMVPPFADSISEGDVRWDKGL